ncbi:hypothetical protein OQA88_10649 [Cercophora sp. LCS_1]
MGDHFGAATALLQHGVDPNGLTLSKRPIKTALDERKWRFVDLLVKYQADLKEPLLLTHVALSHQPSLLRTFLRFQQPPKERIRALVSVAGDPSQHIVLADILLRSGVDINAYGGHLNALQMAASSANLDMFSFLIHRGADVHAPAYPDAGRTALQAALGSESPIELARILFRKGVDVSAPPAMVNGVTAFEAYCHNYFYPLTQEVEQFCGELLDAGAEVNRPNGEPSSVLHGVIGQGWHTVLARCLAPQYNTIANHIWCDEYMYERSPNGSSPYTLTQLASSQGDMAALRMLLEYGTDANELPGHRFGRTALQAACLRDPDPAKMDLVNYLLDRGADVNAEAGLCCGATALQAAAIKGDIRLVELLISKCADVNGMASSEEGRYAIEGAAEHGRLDTVKMLLNAGAKGNCHFGTGFQRAIELAKKMGILRLQTCSRWRDHFI